MLTKVSHALPVANIRRQRYLPVVGSVVVRAGQDVRAEDVIATANLNPKHISLDLERGLGVDPGQVGDYLTREVGENISQGSVIATKKGLFSRVVRAPQNGKLVAVSGGKALLLVSSKPYELKAGIPGSVVDVDAEYGATILATGAWVEGLWGNGQIATDTLKVLAADPNHVLTADQLDPSQHRGTITLAGYCADPKALEMANEVKVSGLILGSISTRLLPLALRMPFPIIVIEGFGKIPLNKAAHTLLTTNEDNETAVNATKYDRFTGERPEIVIPLSAAAGHAEVPINMEELKTGNRVRCLRAPYAGSVGTVRAILPGTTRFPSGVRAEAVELDLENEEKAIVPLANIEILG